MIIFLLQRIIDCMLNFDYRPKNFQIPRQLVNNLYSPTFWVAWLCCSWLSLGESDPNFPWEKFPLRQLQQNTKGIAQHTFLQKCPSFLSADYLGAFYHLMFAAGLLIYTIVIVHRQRVGQQPVQFERQTALSLSLTQNGPSDQDQQTVDDGPRPVQAHLTVTLPAKSPQSGNMINNTVMSAVLVLVQ